jgi:hypothetical protein
MATVRLDNLIKPRQANSPLTTLSKEEEKNLSVFTDLKLDLELANSIGVGINPTQAKDIVVSNDIEAIRNALYNIFTTKKGQKLLDPEFGSSLEQYLFESVSPIIGKIIGDSIVNSIETYEPRVEVLNVTVYPNPEENLYKIKLTFKFVDINKTSSIDILIEKNGQITL